MLLASEDSIKMASDDNTNDNQIEEKKRSVTVAEVAEVTEYVETRESIRGVSKEEIEEEMREVKPREGRLVIIGPPKLTRFERARIVGARALQLSLGAPPLVVVRSDINDSIKLAEYELEQKALPISVRRVLPDGKYQNIPIIWLLD
jgi:DNA-directed RNA polymerase I, II, and III subunit RPABC2